MGKCRWASGGSSPNYPKWSFSISKDTTTIRIAIDWSRYWLILNIHPLSTWAFCRGRPLARRRITCYSEWQCIGDRLIIVDITFPSWIPRSVLMSPTGSNSTIVSYRSHHQKPHWASLAAGGRQSTGVETTNGSYKEKSPVRKQPICWPTSAEINLKNTRASLRWSLVIGYYRNSGKTKRRPARYKMFNCKS